MFKKLCRGILIGCYCEKELETPKESVSQTFMPDIRWIFIQLRCCLIDVYPLFDQWYNQLRKIDVFVKDVSIIIQMKFENNCESCFIGKKSEN